ncbi:tetratricopeptide repeat protein [Emcibacter sp.]|uniref:SPOR domain-containing protein n=1 Tax=Emcibacter sp. TaxID=1979954 RepID=UPI002AA8ECCC|nr:tetratricopeptide repeat protein [Emcibacter sp.]
MKNFRFAKLMATAAVPVFLVACTGGAPYQTGSADKAPKANASAAEVREVASNTDNSFLSLANEMVAEGDYNAAIPLFRRAHKWHPFSSEPLVGLGDSLSATGQYQEAVEAYQRAVDNNEQNVAALKGLGKSYVALNRPTMAVPVLNSAVELAPTDVEVISSLALAMEMQGNNMAALEVYKDGLALDPDNLKLLNNYGLSLALQSRHDEAVNILKQAAQHKDAGASHRQNLAMAYALSGNEVMASRLLSIDSGPELTNENLNYFRVLASMPEDGRFSSVINQSVEPKTDTSAPANEVFEDESLTRSITVARLVEEVPEPVVEAEPEEEDPSVPALLGPEGWALQIAAYRKKSELRPGWEMLKKKYSDIIGHLEPRRSEVDFGDRKGKKPSGFYYRLNAGPLTSFEEANEACKKIREKGTDCWVRPPLTAEGKLPEVDKDKAKPFEKIEDITKGSTAEAPAAAEKPAVVAEEKSARIEESAKVVAAAEKKKADKIVWKLVQESREAPAELSQNDVPEEEDVEPEE